MGVIATIKLGEERGMEADLHSDGSVRLWVGRGMTGAQAWNLRPREAGALFDAFIDAMNGGGWGAQTFKTPEEF